MMNTARPLRSVLLVQRTPAEKLAEMLGEAVATGQPMPADAGDLVEQSPRDDVLAAVSGVNCHDELIRPLADDVAAGIGSGEKLAKRVAAVKRSKRGRMSVGRRFDARRHGDKLGPPALSTLLINLRQQWYSAISMLSPQPRIRLWHAIQVGDCYRSVEASLGHLEAATFSVSRETPSIPDVPVPLASVNLHGLAVRPQFDGENRLTAVETWLAEYGLHALSDGKVVSLDRQVWDFGLAPEQGRSGDRLPLDFQVSAVSGLAMHMALEEAVINSQRGQTTVAFPEVLLPIHEGNADLLVGDPASVPPAARQAVLAAAILAAGPAGETLDGLREEARSAALRGELAAVGSEHLGWSSKLLTPGGWASLVTAETLARVRRLDRIESFEQLVYALGDHAWDLTYRVVMSAVVEHGEMTYLPAAMACGDWKRVMAKCEAFAYFGPHLRGRYWSRPEDGLLFDKEVASVQVVHRDSR